VYAESEVSSDSETAPAPPAPAPAPKVVKSLREFAKEVGVTPMAVSVAVKRGRLKASVLVEGGVCRGIVDVPLAHMEWAKNSDISKAPPRIREKAAERQRALEGDDPLTAGPSGESLQEASATAKFWDSKLKELKYREAAGELIEASQVERKLVEVFTACRTKLLAIPNRARQDLPHLTVPDMAVFEGLIREACEDLAAEASEAEAAIPPIARRADEVAEIRAEEDEHALIGEDP
jgi:phage terminase Nu1 subunit (DNA packaging protein)